MELTWLTCPFNNNDKYGMANRENKIVLKAVRTILMKILTTSLPGKTNLCRISIKASIQMSWLLCSLQRTTLPCTLRVTILSLQWQLLDSSIVLIHWLNWKQTIKVLCLSIYTFKWSTVRVIICKTGLTPKGKFKTRWTMAMHRKKWGDKPMKYSHSYWMES